MKCHLLAPCAIHIENGSTRKARIFLKQAKGLPVLVKSGEEARVLSPGEADHAQVRAAAHDARIIQLAFALGSKVEINLMPIMLKRLVYTGSTLRTRPAEFKARIARELRAQVWPQIEAGHIRTVISRTFPLAEAAKAHATMESAEHVGKILLLTA